MENFHFVFYSVFFFSRLQIMCPFGLSTLILLTSKINPLAPGSQTVLSLHAVFTSGFLCDAGNLSNYVNKSI